MLTRPTATFMAPKRLGPAFSRALVTCPKDVAGYGACVASASASPGGLERDACAAEFAKLKKCFLAALKHARR